MSPQTSRRVGAVIREQGYRPSRRGARAAPLLELAFHEFESEWAGEIIKGAQKVATQHDLGLVLSDLRASPTQDRGWIETVLARRPSGVIVVLAALSDEVRAQLRTRRIPLVVIDPTGEPLHDPPSVGATNWSGGLAATRHLLGLGHRQIRVIAGPESLLCSRARLDGYRAAMDAAGVEVDPTLAGTATSTSTRQSGRGVHCSTATRPRGPRPSSPSTTSRLWVSIWRPETCSSIFPTI